MNDTTRAALLELSSAAENLVHTEDAAVNLHPHIRFEAGAVEDAWSAFDEAIAALGYAKVSSFDADATEVAEAVDVFSPAIGRSGTVVPIDSRIASVRAVFADVDYDRAMAAGE